MPARSDGLMRVGWQWRQCMQSILVLIGGGDRDEVIIRTAHAAAVPLGAYLEFLHVRVSAPVANGMDRPRSRPQRFSECVGGLSGEGAPPCLAGPPFIP
jgi:hypothetical protein